MRRTANHRLVTARNHPAIAGLVALAVLVATPARAVELSFLYTLSDTNGPLPSSWVRLAHDPQAHETFVLDSAAGVVRVFNRTGMETFTFGDDDALGQVSDVAVLEGGDLVLLSWIGGRPALVRCNFRGEPLGMIDVRGAPADAAGFVPDQIRSAGGLLFLANTQAMRVLAIRPDGTWIRTYDGSGAASGKKQGDAGFTGFGVDSSGNVLFTIAPLFQAYVLAPDGTLRSFGVRGGAPGKFNVVGGIAADDEGNLYVTDILRSVVMVFDASFQFRGEFGYRGAGPGNLIAPRDLVVGSGQVFVTQSAARGVSVFRVDPPRGASPSS